MPEHLHFLIAIGVAVAIALAGIIIGSLAYRFIAGRKQRKHERAVRSHAFTHWRWSQDGWVRYCKLCPMIQYGGDDYVGGPDDGGSLV